MIFVKLYKSDRKDKKFYVVVENKKLYFGSSKYSDFTLHKNNERKNNYLKRHMKNENWNDFKTAGFWSRWLLWNKPSLDESIKDVFLRFNLKIMKQF